MIDFPVLIDQFKKLRPKPGERVGIKRVADSEKGYARYVVKVDRPEEIQVPDWDSLGASKERTPPTSSAAGGRRGWRG